MDINKSKKIMSLFVVRIDYEYQIICSHLYWNWFLRLAWNEAIYIHVCMPGVQPQLSLSLTTHTALFFPSNDRLKENIFLSNVGVMLFQVWVMNKLGPTRHVSELIQK